jgi:CHASE3 domain sensor protein
MRPNTLRWRLYALVGGMVLLSLVAVSVTTLARQRVSDLSMQLRGTLRPAQASAAALAKAYVDMETGVRGFLLSGEVRLLEPYHAGREAAESSHGRLGELLAGDATSARLLASVDRAAADWERTVAAPAMRREVVGADSNDLFDAVRRPLGSLQTHIDARAATTIQASNQAQSLANAVTLLCAGLAVLIGAVTVLLLRRSLLRPVNDLVANVDRVAAGDLAHPVRASGPAELITLGGAVESMRERLLRESARAARSTEQVVRLQEADRIAQELGKTTIRDLFAISLALQSAASRHPSAAPALGAVTSDVDRVLRDIRARVFNGNRTIAHVLADVAATPAVTGPVNVPAPEALDSFLRDVLPLYPATTELTVTSTDTLLRVTLTGPPPEDPTLLKEAATDHAATTTYEPDQITIEWSTER